MKQNKTSRRMKKSCKNSRYKSSAYCFMLYLFVYGLFCFVSFGLFFLYTNFHYRFFLCKYTIYVTNSAYIYVFICIYFFSNNSYFCIFLFFLSFSLLCSVFFSTVLISIKYEQELFSFVFFCLLVVFNFVFNL